MASVAIFAAIICVGLLAMLLVGDGGKVSARMGTVLREVDALHHTPSGAARQNTSTIAQALAGTKYAARKRAEKNLLKTLRLFMMGSLVLGAYTFGLTQNPPNVLKWASILAMSLGIFPILYMSKIRKERKAKTEQSLVNVMDLVVIGLEAGMTLPAVLREIVQQEPNPNDPLKLELEQMLSEMDAGLDLNKALRGLAVRSEMPELQILTSAVVQAEKVGSGLAQTFRIYGDDMRSARREKIRTKIQKLPIKMLVPMVLFLLFPLMVLILAPAGISMMTQLGGGQ